MIKVIEYRKTFTEMQGCDRTGVTLVRLPVAEPGDAR